MEQSARDWAPAQGQPTRPEPGYPTAVVERRIPAVEQPQPGDSSTGKKLDAGKNRMGLVLGGFAPALIEVCKVGTFGANKYSDNGWQEVPDGFRRYEDAQLRHQFYRHAGETHDADSGLLHLAHEAWNAIAKLAIYLRNGGKA